ncbi:5-oxoprolinase subunit PxpB [Brevibacillus ruminantium]|uniref:5-oxoprolinase subunit PxpB n=1 Tax=Brevibacillus ruminantium TaxID=2950604 RepID=A0ABY4WPZ2_9BACL|nr:5-oxoprolinase subunit PxpB [Brevibacillus ruminantium]USG68213.1 5-oxoprolinase subunit PxpB [Brevibacillus ruminantium]
MSDIYMEPLGEQAIIIRFGTVIDQNTHEKVRKFAAWMDRFPIPGMVEYIPAYTTVTVFYDPLAVMDGKRLDPHTQDQMLSPYERVKRMLHEALEQSSDIRPAAGNIVEIPVLYGGEMGPDLAEVAAYHQISEEEVIRIHSQGEYQVFMIGFAPGFPYIGGMSEKIATPRKKSPRLRIPSGSVGIAGTQTGIYPLETPGGWQIIGRSPVSLFRPNHNPPSLLQAGDYVRFIPISREAYEAYKEEES